MGGPWLPESLSADPVFVPCGSTATVCSVSQGDISLSLPFYSCCSWLLLALCLGIVLKALIISLTSAFGILRSPSSLSDIPVLRQSLSSPPATRADRAPTTQITMVFISCASIRAYTQYSCHPKHGNMEFLWERSFSGDCGGRKGNHEWREWQNNGGSDSVLLDSCSKSDA